MSAGYTWYTVTRISVPARKRTRFHGRPVRSLATNLAQLFHLETSDHNLQTSLECCKYTREHKKGSYVIVMGLPLQQ